MKKETIAIIISFVLLAGIITAGLLTSKNHKKGSLEPRQEAPLEEQNEVVILNKEPLTRSSLHHLDTADWLTYKAKENFSIKYPSDKWRVDQWGIYPPGCLAPGGGISEECKNLKLKAKYSINGIYREEPYGVHFVIDVWEKAEKLSLQDWIEKVINPTCSSFYCFSLSINDSIKGLACKGEETSSLPGGAIFYTFYLSHKDLIYIFSPYDIGCAISHPDCDFLKQQQVYETIVSTFSIE